MPSELDLRIDAVTKHITSAAGPMPLTTHTHYGVDVPMIATAPPNLGLYFAHFCNQHKDTEFLVDEDERITFGQTYAAARQVAGALVEGWGIKKGDRIGIAMRNAPSWVVLFMGITMAGGCATLINGWWNGPELVAGIDDVECSLVFVDAQRAERLAEVNYAGPAQIVTLDIAQPLGTALLPVMAKGGGAETALPDVGADDLANILFTSGSTGKSKGAYSNHRGVVQGTFSYILTAMVMLHIGQEDGTISAAPPSPCMLLTVPLFHVTGQIPVMLVCFALGRKLVFMRKWDALAAMQLIEREKVTSFTGVPLMSFEILSHPDRSKYDLSTLQGLAGGGAPRPVEHVKRLAEALPKSPPALGYGLTETNAVGAGNYSSNYQAKPDSTGRAAAPLVEIAILDDAGKSVAQGQRGEVCIRSSALFLGYWNREDATKEAMTSDGYFRTGDIGYLDEDGYLFIVDRKKDIIIRGGENISCQEVEAALYECTGVAEACVFGLPDERFGELVGAVIYFHAGQEASADAVVAQLDDKIAKYKIPHRLWIEASPLPRLGTEKIDKVALRKRFQAEYLAAA